MRGQIRKLPQAENGRARSLYEEVFREDSCAFVDYYFRNKISENEIYVVEDGTEILSMLHLNPYRMEICGESADTAYIVAVATKGDCRHQGMMASLLKTSLRDLYYRQSPFTWLMPASAAIYRPFGFRFIYHKNQTVLDEAICRTIPNTEPWGMVRGCRTAQKEDTWKLAYFAGRKIPEIAQIYTCHDVAYFEDLMEMLESDGGQIVLFEESGCICGYFLASPSEGEAWEVVMNEHGRGGLWATGALLRWFEQSGKERIKVSAFPREWERVFDCVRIPTIMGRIVHLERFVKLLRSDRRRVWRVRVRDDLIPENNGVFRITSEPGGGTIRRIANGGGEIRTVGIGELMEEMLCQSVFLNELV